jgi:hypothetical protein
MIEAPLDGVLYQHDETLQTANICFEAYEKLAALVGEEVN